MKLIKLITACFVMAVGLLVPASMTFADSCGHSSDNANTTHPDNDHNGDHNCPVDTTETTVVDTTVPPELPHTGSGETLAVVAAALIAVGGVMVYVKKR